MLRQEYWRGSLLWEPGGTIERAVEAGVLHALLPDDAGEEMSAEDVGFNRCRFLPTKTLSQLYRYGYLAG